MKYKIAVFILLCVFATNAHAQKIYKSNKIDTVKTERVKKDKDKKSKIQKVKISRSEKYLAKAEMDFNKASEIAAQIANNKRTESKNKSDALYASVENMALAKKAKFDLKYLNKIRDKETIAEVDIEKVNTKANIKIQKITSKADLKKEKIDAKEEKAVTKYKSKIGINANQHQSYLEGKKDSFLTDSDVEIRKAIEITNRAKMKAEERFNQAKLKAIELK
ncbi:MAG: hypothetical protein HOD63_09845 [Bacteroidetes bacterium]|nr:hypothetical protein [Bacteroidota bacterium]MBT3935470.1 hypothetical protein [Bacteroidota bacterium]MBT4338882.1 hypothetical protein [Bacteroidota bacterium]MBT4727618.1 hypothetical protein [Bacteroidota bacterium]MBT5991417.1 hypothetical protein [Bacteroidota bacterium]